MDTFELNKIAGAILGSILFVMAIGFLADLLYTPAPLQSQAYVVDVPEGDDHGAAGEEAEEPEPLANMLAAADVDAGARVARKCAACHNFEAGEPNKVGPNLHGIVGRQPASVSDFAYSDTMTEFGASGEVWTYENLAAYLNNPKQWLPGNKMAFAGLRKPDDLANAIVFLRSISPDAPPLPEPVAEEDAAAVEGAAPAEGEHGTSGEAGEADEAAPEEPAGHTAEMPAPEATPAPAQAEPAPAPESGGETPPADTAPAPASPDAPAAN